MPAAVCVMRTLWWIDLAGSDRNADDRHADDRHADTLALAEPDDGSHSWTVSGYARGLGVSTSCIRHMRRRQSESPAGAARGVLPEYSQGTPRGTNSWGADIGTDAVAAAD